ncbi:MAG: patatin-like phospholipase family protein [Deltaproteobacteria bacterium]|nr:patatin-like phospholipase family protein [Deltaproteobacteria bacterium]
MSSRKSVGLVLGSGSSRGWAHIGVIEALEEENIPIDYIAGCSVGSYVGAIYASGSLKSLKDFVLRMDGKKVFSYFDVVFPRSGFLNGTKKVKELFSMHTDVEDFSQLNIPLLMVATDLETGDKVVLRSGNLLNALRATMSIPGLFAPAGVKGRWLVDGGLVDPVPVGLARAMGPDVVIAVDLNSGLMSRKDRKKNRKKTALTEKKTDDQHKYKNELVKKLADYYENAGLNLKNKINELLRKESSVPDIMETITTSIGIMQERMTRINLAVEPPDILIQPRLGELKMMDFDHVEHAIEEGYSGVKLKMEDIRALLEPDRGQRSEI